MILGIDPGARCGFAAVSPSGRVLASDTLAAAEMLGTVRFGGWDHAAGRRSILGNGAPNPVAIEHVGHYGTGMPAGRDVFETCILIGRLIEVFESQGLEVVTVPRQTVKTHLCGRATAKDANVRLALLDRYGGERAALGAVKCQRCRGKGWRGRGRPPCDECSASGWEVPPGPLHGVTGHAWSALAVAIWHAETADRSKP